MPASKSKVDLATRAALLYYDKGLGQHEIARMLDISRSYVSQLLSLARSLGIVRITIQADHIVNEMDFASRFGLKQAYILPSPSGEYTDDAFGAFCKPQTARLLKSARYIGVNLGDTVRRVIQQLLPEEMNESSAECIVQIMGGCAPQKASDSGTMPSELVFRLGSLLNCRCLYLDCPVILSNAAVRDLLMQEEGIKNVLNTWERLDTVLMGMGAAEDSLLTAGNEVMNKQLRSSGAVADINFNFFDLMGQPIALFTENKLVMQTESLRRVPCKAVYAYGLEKAEAILAGLRAGLIDILFTDSITADEIAAIDSLSRKVTENME